MSSHPAANSNEINTDTYRSYLFLWIGQQISIFGSSIVQFAIIWWIALETQSGYYLSLAALIGIGTRVVTQFVAGTVADRNNRKTIIFVTDFLQALVTSVLIILFIQDKANLIHVFILLGIRGVLGGFHSPALAAILPSMVPKENLKQMNSISTIAHNFVDIISPAIAAGAIAIAGLDQFEKILWLDLITFLIAVIILIFTNIPRVQVSGHDDHHGHELTFRQEVKRGFSYMSNIGGFIPLLVLFAIINFFLTPILAIVSLLISSPRGLGATEIEFGLAWIFLNIGSISISIILTRNWISIENIRAVAIGIVGVLSGIIIMGISLYLKSFLLFGMSMLIFGIFGIFANIHFQTLYQANIPAEFQGRVVSVVIAMSSSISPLGIIIFGLFIDKVDFAPLITSMGIMASLFVMVIWRRTDVAHVELNINSLYPDIIDVDHDGHH